MHNEIRREEALVIELNGQYWGTSPDSGARTTPERCFGPIERAEFVEHSQAHIATLHGGVLRRVAITTIYEVDEAPFQPEKIRVGVQCSEAPDNLRERQATAQKETQWLESIAEQIYLEDMENVLRLVDKQLYLEHVSVALKDTFGLLSTMTRPIPWKELPENTRFLYRGRSYKTAYLVDRADGVAGHYNVGR